MVLFPNILDPSVYNRRLYLQQQPHQPPHTHPEAAPDSTFLHRHHASELFIAFLSHVFSPSVYLQPASSHHHYSLPCTSTRQTRAPVVSRKYKMIIDDDFVVTEEREVFGEEDEDEGMGVPLCREAEIERWRMGDMANEQRSILC